MRQQATDMMRAIQACIVGICVFGCSSTSFAQTKRSSAKPLSKETIQVTQKSKTGNIRGEVRDRKGKPIDKAIVEIRLESKEMKTSRDGDYRFTGLEAEKKYTLDVTKPLYKDSATDVNVQAERDNEAPTVILEYEGVNVNTILKLERLLNSKEYQAFDTDLSLIAVDCGAIEEDDCNAIREIKRPFDQSEVADVRARLESLRRRKKEGN